MSPVAVMCCTAPGVTGIQAQLEAPGVSEGIVGTLGKVQNPRLMMKIPFYKAS